MNISGLASTANNYTVKDDSLSRKKAIKAYHNERLTGLREKNSTENVDEKLPSSLSFTTMHYNKDVRISDESVQQWNEIIEKKRQSTLNTIQHLCSLIGRQAPEHYDDITETDYAIYQAERNFAREGGYYISMGACINTVYDYDNQPVGFKHIYKNAYKIAEMQCNSAYLFSNEGINSLVNSGWKLSENVDKKAVYDVLKSISQHQKNKLDESIEKTIDNIASSDAIKYLAYITGDFESGYGDRMKTHESYESLCNSIKELLRESILCAKELIKDGVPKDYLSKMEARSYENSAVKFQINGKEYSRRQFEDGFKNLLLGKSNIFG